MDEKVKIFFIDVWFNPLILPIIALNEIKKYKIFILLLTIIFNDNTRRGAIFCVVINKKKFCQERPSTKAGIQLCNGAAAIFNNNAKVNKNEFIWAEKSSEILIRIITEAIAWIIKYLTATSLWYFLGFLKIKGINIKILISKQSQIISHELDEEIIIIENNKKIKNIILDGWRKMLKGT